MLTKTNVRDRVTPEIERLILKMSDSTMFGHHKYSTALPTLAISNTYMRLYFVSSCDMKYIVDNVLFVFLLTSTLYVYRSQRKAMVMLVRTLRHSAVKLLYNRYIPSGLN